jgi:hypothetical protein
MGCDIWLPSVSESRPATPGSLRLSLSRSRACAQTAGVRGLSSHFARIPSRRAATACLQSRRDDRTHGKVRRAAILLATSGQNWWPQAGTSLTAHGQILLSLVSGARLLPTCPLTTNSVLKTRLSSPRCDVCHQ